MWKDMWNEAETAFACWRILFHVLLGLSWLDFPTDAIDGLTGLSQATSGMLDVELDGGHFTLVGKRMQDLGFELGLKVFKAHFGHGVDVGIG